MAEWFSTWQSVVSPRIWIPRIHNKAGWAWWPSVIQCSGGGDGVPRASLLAISVSRGIDRDILAHWLRWTGSGRWFLIAGLGLLVYKHQHIPYPHMQTWAHTYVYYTCQREISFQNILFWKISNWELWRSEREQYNIPPLPLASLGIPFLPPDICNVSQPCP